MKLKASTQILHGLGRAQESATVFDALLKEDAADELSFQQAQIFAQQGKLDLAMERLSRAYELGDPGLTQLKIDPCLDPLHDDRRFKRLMTKVGFEDQ